MLCHFEAHYYWCHLSAGCALVGLPAVMHGLPSSMAHPRGGHYYGTAERGIAKRDTMSCEACDAEPTEARHLARGERQRNPESPTHPPFGERKKQITHSSRVCNRAAVVVFLGAFRSPHSRLWRQCGVIDDVTARAVNITDFQYVCSAGAFPRRWCVWVSHRLI